MIYTIGYGNRTLIEFRSHLERYGIGSIVDVRNSPFGYYRHFHRPNMEETFTGYVWKGDKLGGFSHAEIDEMKRLMGALIRHAEHNETNIVFMCAEGDPTACHRFLLLTPLIEEMGYKVNHILRNGELMKIKAMKLTDFF